MIKIEKADNGYVATWISDVPVLENQATVFVIEEPQNDERGEEKSFLKLCEVLASLEGFTYDKFSKDNFRCSFDLKGHKLGEKVEPKAIIADNLKFY